MYDQKTFLRESPDQIVNPASVRQRSPFRYPGGKTWLIPKIRLWLASKSIRPHKFIEVFAGGGIVSLTVAAENLAECVEMIELDTLVAAVWKTILHDDDGGQWLAEKIVSFKCDVENVKAILKDTSSTTRDLAFHTIVKNRVNRGGIMAPGAGIIKAGENGKGVLSRWYPETLKKRILDIVAIRDRITFSQEDGLEVLRRYAQDEYAVFFIDPPYTASKKRSGSRLYTHTEIDHKKLFDIAASLAGDFLMTYDNAEEIHSLADIYGFDTQPIAMKNTHHAKMTELIIGRDLAWLRQ